jgi:hypothetical protein
MPDTDEQTQQDGNTSESALSAGVHRQRPSFSGSGMPGQSSSQSRTKNLITFGICLAVMLAALLLVKLFKRRK